MSLLLFILLSLAFLYLVGVAVSYFSLPLTLDEGIHPSLDSFFSLKSSATHPLYLLLGLLFTFLVLQSAHSFSNIAFLPVRHKGKPLQSSFLNLPWWLLHTSHLPYCFILDPVVPRVVHSHFSHFQPLFLDPLHWPSLTPIYHGWLQRRFKLFFLSFF